ncbi:CXXC-20-CXXC protein [Virgibacillus natechei]|uniref:CXXC-20-CXXC protein n=1 Tax=Virgibacillus natechei TaxID=1216297 RepID=A0ABS4IJI7_9BACI|nr:TIGR04104 family putative zinc finger protein [Virgibacillus natechei]MBP1971086.1 CXXC-20-CXXC protein [Virgibacillus natechei]UZD13028.1 hypothetical protein OLD84_00160 [Virgibacillus natechei]
MPTCAHCGMQWRYKDTLKQFFRVRMICPFCEERNFPSSKGGKKIGLFNLILLPLVIFLGTFLDLSSLWIFITVLILALTIFSVTPYFIELSKDKEALW